VRATGNLRKDVQVRLYLLFSYLRLVRVNYLLSPLFRLLVVKAEEPIKLANLLTKPAHSIINQASDSRLRLDAG
jgi:hypothetical protein